MNKELVIVFVKNIRLGKVKTRLAKTIGNQGAFDVYTELVSVTEQATQELKQKTMRVNAKKTEKVKAKKATKANRHQPYPACDIPRDERVADLRETLDFARTHLGGAS